MRQAGIPTPSNQSRKQTMADGNDAAPVPPLVGDDVGAIGLGDPSQPTFHRPSDQEILNYERRIKVRGPSLM